MANQVTVSNDHSISVTIEPPANVQVQISRAVIGTVANVASANLANYVIQNSQPNITSVGTLVGLTSNGNITAPFFIGNVVGNISGNLTVPGSNTAVLFNQQGNAGASDALTFNYSSNVLTANGNIIANYYIGDGSQLTGIVTAQSNNANFANFANFAGNAFSVSGSNVTGAVSFATTANAVAGANVSGAVSFATTANSVALANVSGAGNIASINISGNTSQILYGNGVFAAAPVVSNVANANYANFAGEAFNVSASNITGVVNLANFATTANAVAGANVSGAVANATHANTSDSATTAGTVTTNAQPNITSVGILTGLVVSGNITPNANITYDLGNNTNRFKDLYLAGNSIILGAQTISANATGISFTGNLSGDASGLANITGANVTGQVGNALVASTVYTNAQPNITSVGNLTSVTVSGDGLIAGNLTVGGNISYVNVNNLVVQDPVIELGGGPNGAPLTTNDGKDRGTLLHYYTTAPIDAFMGWDNGNGEFAFGSNVTNNTDVMTFNTFGNVRAQTFIGNLTGIAGSATVANSANAVAGANVSGAVAFATTANSVAVANVSGLGNIATTNFDGNASNVLYGNGNFYALPTVSNVANANYANFAGTAYSVSGSNVSGEVANANYSTYSGTAGTANSVAGANVSGAVGLATFATTANAVAGANVSGEVAFAATANSVALANVSGAGNIASINLDGNVSNLLTGSGTFVAIPTVSSNANYANFAGQVVDNTQSNITQVGNLSYLQVSNSANADGVINQFGSNNITFATNSTNIGTYQLTTEYHPNASTGYPGHRIIRSRGNATTPTTAVNLDRVFQRTGLVFNGTVNPLVVSEVVTATGGINANANAVWSGGQWQMTTGNPIGDVGNANASSGLNALLFTNSGSLQITPGAPANTSLGQASTPLLITNFGLTSTDLASAGGINQQKARGNRDGLLSVQPGDTVGRQNFWGYNGTTYATGRVAALYANVDSSYVANATVIPYNMVITTVSNSNTSVNTVFYANGLTSLPGNLNVTGTSNLGNVGNVRITGGTANYVLSTDGTGNLDWVAQSGGGGTPGGSNTELQFNNNGTFGGISTVTYNGSNISLGAVANVKVTGGSNNEVMRTDGTGNLSFSSIAQNLLVGTRAGPYTVPITNYTFQVTTRSSGNVTVYVN